uniref:Uncharacterized protein n=1 Tax=Ignisphaera aggregans TaxID=334771 RepID=A0A7J2U6E5_9CREN
MMVHRISYSLPPPSTEKQFLSFLDYGASRDYAVEVVDSVCRALKAKCEAVAEVSYLEQPKSSQLKA